jgi:2-succinyl-5-enolpyruvyl-6-hydroxy-3-cyclohexene-1-carboxylate synthase
MGIDRVVISPGSRNAPLIIGFKALDEITLYSIVDERSAGFFALGMAQQLRKPVALVCTSGSALLNYYPAVSEAFYNDIPLVVISADRPEHLIDIGDGQTIRQEGVLDKHVLDSVNYNTTEKNDCLQRVLNTALHRSGPVHINIPFDEPLYDLVESNDVEPFESSVEVIEDQLEESELRALAKTWNSSKRKLVLVGEYFPEPRLKGWLKSLADDPSVLVLIENTANVADPSFINSIDKLIFPFEEEELDAFRPELLLTLGGMIVSKQIKQHLRAHRPDEHWHVDGFKPMDTFHSLNRHINVAPESFFTRFLPLLTPVNSDYRHYWLDRMAFRLQRHDDFLKECPYSDLKVFDIILRALPEHSQLQLGNSSVIRYTQLFDVHPSIQVFCNRGTSGIDGCTSTAIGAAVVSDNQTVFISGDLSFFYDSNGLWNNYMPDDFRIIVINNGGGGIFRFIPGPSDSGALDYFETPHQMDASYLCAMYGLNYYSIKDADDLAKQLEDFMEDSRGPSLMEIFTPRETNDEVLRSYFKFLKQ